MGHVQWNREVHCVNN
uniref:Uncharacterized protein n=1 Tax=Rhizophora mucronata TaxID=61149 RepID=A0A2P2R218_RHIMU